MVKNQVETMCEKITVRDQVKREMIMRKYQVKTIWGGGGGDE